MKTSSVGSKESQTKASHRLRLEISENATCPSSQSVRILPAVHLKGFTLIEVLVVLVLLAALTAVAAPSIARGFGAIELQTTARQVAATLRLARTRAVREQQVFLVGFDLEKNRIELMREDLSFRRTFELPESIAIHRVTRKGEAPLDDVRFTCLFVPNGLSESFEVWLRNKRGKELKVVQDSLRKSPRIEDVETDETDTGR
jgi:general secretion pathway protein H